MTAYTCPEGHDLDVLWRNIPMHASDGAAWPERPPYPPVDRLCPWSMGDTRSGTQHPSIAAAVAEGKRLLGKDLLDLAVEASAGQP